MASISLPGFAAEFRRSQNRISGEYIVTLNSAPVVSGVVARLLQVNPTWTPAQIAQHISSTATAVSTDLDLGPSHFNNKLIYISPGL